MYAMYVIMCWLLILGRAISLSDVIEFFHYDKLFVPGCRCACGQELQILPIYHLEEILSDLGVFVLSINWYITWSFVLETRRSHSVRQNIRSRCCSSAELTLFCQLSNCPGAGVLYIRATNVPRSE